MADMFGAPIGIGAAEQDMRQNVLGGLQATKALSEIEAAPLHDALLKAQARHFNAESAVKEAEASQASEALRLLGEPSSTLGGAGSTDPSLMSDPALAMANAQARVGNILLRTGQFTKGSTILNQASEALNRIVTGKTSEQTGIWRESEAARYRLQMAGSIAGSALADQTAYDRAKPQLKSLGIPVEGFPPDIESARGLLTQMRNAGMTGAEQVRVSAAAAAAKAREVTDRALVTSRYATAAAANARVKQITEDIARKQKYGGNASAEMRDLRIARTEAIKASGDARLEKSIPPADRTKWVLGKAYWLPAAKVWGTWSGKDFTPLAKPPAAASAEPDAGDDSEDE